MPATGASGFRLVRYFTLTSLAVFLVVAAALAYLEQREGAFFKQVQREQSLFFRQAQEKLAHQQEAAARSNLLAVREAGNVNMARLLANALWEEDFAPFVAKAQKIPVDLCRRAVDANGAGGKPAETGRRKACFAGIGRQVMALPGFAGLDGKVYGVMKGTTVFKIKVFDLRGITVYSSEHGQIGDDSSGNQGWRSASRGDPASELTHRDKFSAFEGVVENRDLISSYLPVRAPGSGRIVGVFEIYSDVTPFLAQITGASAQIRALAADNQAGIEQAAAGNQAKVEASSNVLLAIVLGLLVVLYVSLFLLVRNGQRIIDRREHERELAIVREQQWHREKMAALSAMAANVAHEIGNPLATILALAEDIAAGKSKAECRLCQPDLIVDQTHRIAAISRQMADFAASRSENLEPVDVNQMVKSVCDFMRFDRRFRATTIEFRPGPEVLTCIIVPDHLTEVLMDLIQICAGANGPLPQAAGTLIETAARGDGVLIRVACQRAPDAVHSVERAFADARIEHTHRLVERMGGRVSLAGGSRAAIEIVLPRARAQAAAT